MKLNKKPTNSHEAVFPAAHRSSGVSLGAAIGLNMNPKEKRTSPNERPNMIRLYGDLSPPFLLRRIMVMMVPDAMRLMVEDTSLMTWPWRNTMLM